MKRQPFPQYDFSRLSFREFQIIRLAALGYRNEDIAHELNISVGLVKKSRAALLAQYGVPRLIPLCISAALQGLIT